MCWRVVDEGLIRRGELLLSLDFLESYDLELSVLNCGKVGRPYRVTYMYVVLCGLILPLWVLLLFVGSYFACMFISVLYMYAFVFSSLSMFSMFLDI
jgi:hypothetical protein